MSRNDKLVNEAYLRFIRRKPCLACMTRQDVTVHHLKARGTGEGKRNDYSGVPLCSKCHALIGSMGTTDFCRVHHIVNIWMEVFYLITEFLSQYELTKRTN